MADEEAKYAQAVRFLTSLRSQRNQDIEAQRSFLQSKGLSEDVIARALEDVKRPDSIAEEMASQAAGAVESESDHDAFERAARMFDQPLSAEASSSSSSSPAPAAPPKTYPRSPLALYYQPGPGQQQQMHNVHSETMLDNPMTRYDVLLGFFRSFCYFLVLGGGVTGMVVALYRTYLLPRMVTTLDCRSLLLKHHLDQYSILTNRIKSLRGNSLFPNSIQSTMTPRKGVLKKVQFADEISGEKHVVEEEEKKEAGEKESIMEAKVNLSELEDVKQGEGEEGEEMKEIDSNEKTVKSINVMESVQSSLTRLSQSLKADLSASAIGTAIAPQTQEERVSPVQQSTVTTVEEESDADSWISEEDSDELEFDPYSPSSKSKSKRKHTPTAAKAVATASTASSTTAVSLNSSLSTLNAYINSQTYMASANIYGGSRSLGLGSMGGTTSNGDKEGSKAGDVAQIRADIRNLKGLLLSRRNFPIYRANPQVTASQSNAV